MEERQLDHQECPTACWIPGLEEMVRNNDRINKWVRIYIHKCTREVLFLILVKGLKNNLLNVCSMLSGSQ